MTPFGAGMALLLLAGLAALLLQRRPRTANLVFRIGIVAGSGLAAWPALAGLLPGGGSLPRALGPWFGLDPLSSWFLIVVLGVGTVIAMYGVPYLEAERGHRPVGRAHLLLTVLLIALSGVMTARTVLAFLASWEIMAVSAWLLVIFESEKPEVRRAGMIYLVLTHLSTLTLLGMFAAWGGWIDGSFEALGASATAPVGLILLLALIGFGIKAGMVPVHFWLPGAHASAPSHISALLSGIMLKTGIYGLLRVVMLLPAAPPAWWGWTVLLLGLASSVLGVLWALAQHDIKRLLAYHSVENIGIILLGVGLGALGITYRQPVIALLGVSGALLHTLNHALFKSLLFLGAGAVGRAAGTREIDRLGGLAKPLPRTALAFLLGSIAIVGLPPLNGFVSEWLIFLGLLEAGSAEGGVQSAIAVTAGLALTGGLALACFAKLFGTVFLGTPRDPSVTALPGSDRGLVSPQMILAAMCGAIGLLPGAVLPAVGRVTRDWSGETAPEFPIAAASTTAISLVGLALVGTALVIWLMARRRMSRAPVAVRETWACGYPAVTSRMQYSASSFAASLLSAFGPLSGSRVIAGPDAIHVEPADPVLDRAGIPLWNRIRRAAGALRVIQQGRLWWYLLYVIFTLVALLVYLWMVTA
jgi:hydrogenase-4 component B